MSITRNKLEILQELLSAEKDEKLSSYLRDLVKICIEQQDEIANLRRMILAIDNGETLYE